MSGAPPIPPAAGPGPPGPQPGPDPAAASPQATGEALTDRLESLLQQALDANAATPSAAAASLAPRPGADADLAPSPSADANLAPSPGAAANVAPPPGAAANAPSPSPGAAPHAAPRPAAGAGAAPALGIAVSGGSDSTALLLAAARLRGVRVEAATVDHRLRPEAAAEARAVAALCARLGLPHATLVWQEAPGAGNLAQAARDARARLLSDWARGRGLAAVALGHTLDDQAETLLLRLARGSGLDGLSSMRALSRRQGAVWLRPALTLPREALRGWLRDAGVPWHDDPSNADLAHDRPRARAALAALAPLGVTAPGLAAAAARLAEDADHLADRTLALIRRVAAIGPAGEIVVARAPLLGAPPPLRRRALSRLVARLADARHVPRAAAIEALTGALAGDRPVRKTLHGVLIDAGAAAVILSREPAGAPESAPPDALWDGRWRLETPLAGPRTRLGPLGPAGLQALGRLAKTGLWTPPEGWKSAPRAARCVSPALWDGDSLIAAPLAAYGDAAVFDALANDLGLETAPLGHVCSR